MPSPRERFRHLPRWLVLLGSLVLILLIGWFDYATAWEWSFFAPYAVPLVLVAWKAGWRVGILFSSLCTLLFWASHAQENPYHSPRAFALAVLAAGSISAFSWPPSPS